MKLKNIFVGACLALSTLLSATAISAEEWITEEVLKQLTEIRQELKGLRKEVSDLKAAADQRGGEVAFKAEPRKSIAIGDSPVLGDSSAKVAIVEFSDYQCPYCRRHFTQTLPGLTEKYVDSGQVQYMMKDYPLDFHPQAKPAAAAVHCAGKQNSESYWAMHHKLFSGEVTLSADSYDLAAVELGLDQKAFLSCTQSADTAQKIDNDLASGQQVGVRGTPAFLIGKVSDGKVVDAILLSGAQPLAAFERQIDRLLN